MTSADFTYIQAKMEPQSPSVARQSRKRNFSQTSWSSSSSTMTSERTKKVKKYQLDPSSDPTVKNALAAKNNREKKKREEMELKRQNDELKTNNAFLEIQLEESVKRQVELAQMLDEERKKNALGTSGPYPQQSTTQFFQSVMGEVAKMAEIPAVTTGDFDNIDTSQWSSGDEELFPSLQSEKPDKQYNSLDEILALFNTNNEQDPLLPQCDPVPTDDSVDLCGDGVNQRIEYY